MSFIAIPACATTISLNTTTIGGSSYVTFDNTTCSISGTSYTGSFSVGDWVFFGAGTNQTRVEKAATDYIGSISSNVTSKTASGAFYQSWTGGTPTATGTNSRNETYQGTGSSSGGNTYMTFTATMSSTSAHFYLIMSNFYTDSSMVVNVNGSSQTFTTIFGSTSGSVSKLFDISIADVDAGDTLTVTLNNYTVNSSWGNLVPWAAAMTTVVPEPLTAGLLAVGGAFIFIRRRRNRF